MFECRGRARWSCLSRPASRRSSGGNSSTSTTPWVVTPLAPARWRWSRRWRRRTTGRPRRRCARIWPCATTPCPRSITAGRVERAGCGPPGRQARPQCGAPAPGALQAAGQGAPAAAARGRPGAGAGDVACGVLRGRRRRVGACHVPAPAEGVHRLPRQGKAVARTGQGGVRQLRAVCADDQRAGRREAPTAGSCRTRSRTSPQRGRMPGCRPDGEVRGTPGHRPGRRQGTRR